VADNALCGESDARTQAFVATENGRKIAQANASRDGSLPVSQAVETTVVERKQILERGRAKVDIPSGRLTLTEPLDAPQDKAAQASQSASARERKQALEHEQEWDRAEALARALTSSLQGELDAVRSAAETERIKQKQLLDQEQGRAATLARELASLKAELDKARLVGLETVQATEADIKQKQALDQERGRADTLARELASLKEELDRARTAGPEVAQAAEAAIKQKEALEQAINRERDRADALARELTSVRSDLDTARAAALETARTTEAGIKQKQASEQAIKQERDKADALAHELTSVRADLDTARSAAAETARTTEAGIKQKEVQEQAIKQERDRADALARKLTSVRADLNTARTAAAETARTTEAGIKQKQALEQAIKLERDRADALAREPTSVRADLDLARAETAQITKAAKIEQERALEKERDKTETLARELAAARKEADARSARLAAAHAEVLQMTETNDATAAEQKLALASERDRADALARELTSARDELEAGKRQIAALTALRALPSSSSTVEGNGSAEQMSDKAAASISRGSSVSELPRPGAPSAAREATSHLVPKVAAGTERSTSARAAPSSLADEQRLLARANALLALADISGARPLLQHALERGSARAAFLLAETYDARVLQSWRASGIAGDRTKARELYERARAGGIEDAKERIEALK